MELGGAAAAGPAHAGGIMKISGRVGETSEPYPWHKHSEEDGFQGQDIST